MMNPHEVSSQLLAQGKRPTTVLSLIDLFRRDRELFFALALVGVPPDAEPWAADLGRLATRLRAAVKRGYSISTDNGTKETQVRSGADLLTVAGAGEREVVAFLRELNGTGRGGQGGKDYSGTAISEAEALFGLDDGEDNGSRLERQVKAKPLVLRLDEPDRHAVIGGLPGYAVYGLRHSATKLVQSAAVMYRHLRREGRLQNGYAFCGRLPTAYDNAGKVIGAPEGMVYVVYADPDGYVFDWDWVKENPHYPGYPIDPELRFTADPEPVVPDAVLVGVEDLVPARFDAQQAWFSPHGDCIFCYFSDDFAYADRINNDLTVFRSVKTQDPTGFKIKNVEKIVEAGVFQVEAPDLGVRVQAFLFATFQRNPDMKYLHIYGVLINQWSRSAVDSEPPKITLPRLRETCGAAP
jgi:hypothetical protein